MKERIIFYARDEQKDLFPKIALKLENVNIVFIVQNTQEEKVVRSYNIQAKIYNLSKFIYDNWNNSTLLDQIELNKVEKKYGTGSLWHLYYTDRFLIKYKFTKAIKYLKLHIAFVEQILKTEKPNYFINEEVAILSSYLFFIIGKFFNCKYIGFSMPRNFSLSKVLVTNDAYTNFPLVDFYYKKRDFNESELETSRKILDEIKSQKSKPEYMLFAGKRPRFNLKLLLSFLNALYLLTLYKNEKYDYIGKSLSIEKLKKVRNNFRYLTQANLYCKPVENESFILFPLHVQPEASTLVQASNYENQLIPIEIIAKNLPVNLVLYVKEHYAELGHRKTSFYKKIKSLPNVRLITPFVDSHDLLNKSNGVVVLTSTLGWEALIYKKPCYILGNVYFEKFKYAIKVDDPSNIYSLIKNHEFKEDYESEFVYYFTSYLKAMKDGNYILSSPNVQDDKNINALATIIRNEIESKK